MGFSKALALRRLLCEGTAPLAEWAARGGTDAVAVGAAGSDGHAPGRFTWLVALGMVGVIGMFRGKRSDIVSLDWLL
jgi:hypothetical protein